MPLSFLSSLQAIVRADLPGFAKRYRSFGKPAQVNGNHDMPRTKDDRRQLGTPCKDEAGFTCQALHKVVGCRSEILPA